MSSAAADAAEKRAAAASGGFQWPITRHMLNSRPVEVEGHYCGAPDDDHEGVRDPTPKVSSVAVISQRMFLCELPPEQKDNFLCFCKNKQVVILNGCVYQIKKNAGQSSFEVAAKGFL